MYKPDGRKENEAQQIPTEYNQEQTLSLSLMCT
jgi:hypothetical protein